MNRHLFELILAIKRKCQCNEEQIQSQLGLSQAAFNGLIVLDERQGIPGGEFSTRMGLSPSRGSRVLEMLVGEGYAKTQASPTDRRAILVSLTGKGRRMKTRIVDRMQSCEERLRGDLDEARLGQLTEALEWLATAL